MISSRCLLSSTAVISRKSPLPQSLKLSRLSPPSLRDLQNLLNLLNLLNMLNLQTLSAQTSLFSINSRRRNVLRVRSLRARSALRVKQVKPVKPVRQVSRVRKSPRLLTPTLRSPRTVQILLSQRRPSRLKSPKSSLRKLPKKSLSSRLSQIWKRYGRTPTLQMAAE